MIFGFLFLILVSTIVLINEKINFEKRIKIPNIISVTCNSWYG